MRIIHAVFPPYPRGKSRADIILFCFRSRRIRQNGVLIFDFDVERNAVELCGHESLAVVIGKSLPRPHDLETFFRILFGVEGMLGACEREVGCAVGIIGEKVELTAFCGLELVVACWEGGCHWKSKKWVMVRTAAGGSACAFAI